MSQITPTTTLVAANSTAARCGGNAGRAAAVARGAASAVVTVMAGL
jgi:hypothetical protein